MVYTVSFRPCTGDMLMHAHLVKIGNSRGVRLPKAVIEEAGLGEELDLEVHDGAVVLPNADRPRLGGRRISTLKTSTVSRIPGTLVEMVS
jgi:hypothetical protein